MIAAMYGYEDIVRVLAEKEAGMKDKYDYTALHYTAKNSSTKKCAQFLWQFPEERDTTGLEEIKQEHNLPRV